MAKVVVVQVCSPKAVAIWNARLWSQHSYVGRCFLARIAGKEPDRGNAEYWLKRLKESDCAAAKSAPLALRLFDVSRIVADRSQEPPTSGQVCRC